MKKKKLYGFVMVLVVCVAGSAFYAAPTFAVKKDIGYRKLMLGQSRDRVKEIVKSEFSGEYRSSDEGGTIVLNKAQIDKPVAIIMLVFDHNDVLYKINVKTVKNKTNPPPDEAVKVMEAKYGAPWKKTIANNLDLSPTGILTTTGTRYYFQNIMAWDKYEVQYTDTELEKRKEAHEKEMNKKPADKNIDF